MCVGRITGPECSKGLVRGDVFCVDVNCTHADPSIKYSEEQPSWLIQRTSEPISMSSRTARISAYEKSVASIPPRPPRSIKSFFERINAKLRGNNHRAFRNIHVPSFFNVDIAGSAIVRNSLRDLTILNVATSSEGRKCCCRESPSNPCFLISISRSSLSCFLSADSGVVSRSTAVSKSARRGRDGPSPCR